MSLWVEKFVTTGIGWHAPNKSSQRTYRNHLKKFDSFLHERGKVVTDGTVTKQDINDYIADMQAKGSKSNTVASRIAVIKACFKWLLKNKKITTAPKIRSQPRGLVVHKKVTQDSLKKVFDFLNSSENQNNLSRARDAAVLGLMTCGLKTEEIVSLNVKNVDFEHFSIHSASGIFPFMKVSSKLKNYALLKSAAGIISLPNDPFFLNRHKQRIAGRSLRRHLEKHIAATKTQKFSTRDLHWTWKCAEEAR